MVSPGCIQVWYIVGTLWGRLLHKARSPCGIALLIGTVRLIVRWQYASRSRVVHTTAVAFVRVGPSGRPIKSFQPSRRVFLRKGFITRFAKRSALSKRTRKLGHYHAEPHEAEAPPEARTRPTIYQLLTARPVVAWSLDSDRLACCIVCLSSRRVSLPLSVPSLVCPFPCLSCPLLRFASCYA